MGGQRYRRPEAPRPDGLWPCGDRRDEPAGHARRSQPCFGGRDAPGAYCVQGAGNLHALQRLTLQDHPRNVPDDVLRMVRDNGGVVMVNFYPGYLSKDVRAWSVARATEEARAKAQFVGQPDSVESAMKSWDAAHSRPATPIGLVADHIDYIARLAGHDHVGIGGDLDGVPYTADGLEDVSGYPRLFAELIRRGWSDADLAKLAGGNALRAMRRAEAVAI